MWSWGVRKWRHSFFFQKCCFITLDCTQEVEEWQQKGWTRGYFESSWVMQTRTVEKRREVFHSILRKFCQRSSPSQRLRWFKSQSLVPSQLQARRTLPGKKSLFIIFQGVLLVFFLVMLDPRNFRKARLSALTLPHSWLPASASTENF